MAVTMNLRYRFEDFTLDREQRVLLRRGTPLPLTPKAFDTLLVLVENCGRIVEKSELIKRVWPDSFVEESNLTFNIQQLRKWLGDNARTPRYIETVPRRGYRFIATVEKDDRLGHDGPFGTSGAHPEVIAVQLSTTNNPERYFVPSSRKAFAFVIVAVLFLAIIGLVLLRSSRNSSRDLREFVASLPLNIERLTATGESPHAAISTDGKYLAYTRGFFHSQSIWLRQLATNTNIQIVPAQGAIFGLAFTHSGEYLYFVRGEPTALYRVSLLGDVPIKTLDRLEGKFSVSSDDRQIAIVRASADGDSQQRYSLITANADGTGERTLLTRKYPDKLDAPVWSPDNESILCAQGNSAGGGQGVSLLQVNVKDGTTHELSSERFANIAKIAFLPQERGLIMSAAKTSEGYLQLWRVTFPSMEFKQVTAGLVSYADLSITENADKIVASQATRTSDVWVGESREPANLKKITAATDKFGWTPTERLVYSSRNSGNEDLWIMQPDGSEQKQLTVDSRSNATPAVTPDNQRIVFMSNRTGVFQVWRMNIDGSSQIQLTNGGGKNFPSLSPDGKQVVYNSTDNWDVWRISTDGGEAVQLTQYPGYFPSVSPDGKLIACLGSHDSKAALLILPFTGGPPVKSFALGPENFSGTRIAWTLDSQALLYEEERDGVITLVRQPLNGEGVREILKLEDDVFDFGYSPDGKLLAVTRGGWQHDVVMISDLHLN